MVVTLAASMSVLERDQVGTGCVWVLAASRMVVLELLFGVSALPSSLSISRTRQYSRLQVIRHLAWTQTYSICRSKILN